MSSLIGQRGERWSLARAVDALRDAARQAGRPGLVWVVGLLYPSVGIGTSWVAGLSIGQDRVEELPLENVFLGFGLWLCLAFVCFPLFRLVAGLARVSTAAAWNAARGDARTPRLRALWHGGQGMTLSVIALWVLLSASVVLATLAIALPAQLLMGWIREHGMEAAPAVLGVFVLGPIVLVFVGYVLAIAVLVQLALHSLSHNRRGVGSALHHGWRILRHDVAATGRAVLVDVLLTFAVGTVAVLIGTLIPSAFLDGVCATVLTGYAGVARAAYWARAYRALGGLSPDDGVPGLPLLSRE